MKPTKADLQFRLDVAENARTVAEDRLRHEQERVREAEEQLQGVREMFAAVVKTRGAIVLDVDEIVEVLKAGGSIGTVQVGEGRRVFFWKEPGQE